MLTNRIFHNFFLVCFLLCFGCLLVSCAGSGKSGKVSSGGPDDAVAVIGKKDLHRKIEAILAKSLAGFAESADGEALAFVIMMEHFVGSNKFHLEAQDRICDILCRYLDK